MIILRKYLVEVTIQNYIPISDFRSTDHVLESMQKRVTLALSLKCPLTYTLCFKTLSVPPFSLYASAPRIHLIASSQGDFFFSSSFFFSS